MKKIQHYNSFLSILLLLLSFAFSGCGEKPQPPLEEKKQEESVVSSIPDIAMTEGAKELRGSMKIQELSWPDPDLGIRELMEEGQKMQSGKLQLIDGAVYREVSVYDEKDYSGQGTYIQKLEAPYESWTITAVPEYFTDGEKEYFIGRHFYYQGKMAFCMLRENAEVTRPLYWASCNEEGEVKEVLGGIPKELEAYTFAVSEAGNIYAYDEGGRELICLSESMELVKKLKLSARIQGIISEASGEKEYWYGDDNDKGFGIYDLLGEKVIQDIEEWKFFSAHADIGGNGEIYIASESKLWIVNEKELQVVCDFGLCDYPWQELYNLEVQKDGSIVILGKLDNNYCLARVAEEDEVQKEDRQELVIAFREKHAAMLKSISRFNRKNDKYHISVILKESDENWQEYNRRIQMEISAGRGPDIISDDLLLDVSGYLENGYFASLEGVLEDESKYLQAALEGGRVNGELYGMPYDFQMKFATYSQNFVGNRTSWTLPELMKAVEKSEAEILHYDYDGVDIVMWYGLYDNDNTAYIDWGKGESHLTEEPFLKLLDFAKRYADKDKGKHQSNEITEGEMLLNGKAIATDSTMYDFQELNALNACFEGKPAIWGYPRTEGSGIYATGRYLYVNNMSAGKEGAIAFLQFLMSEEEQSRYMIFEPALSGSYGYVAYLPVNLNAFQKLIVYGCNLKEKRNYHSDERGMSYETEDLTKEQVAQINTMLEQVRPDNWYARSIQSIVSEELEPYFAGEKTAEDVAEILDRRVQLYLDEQK